MIYSIPPAAVEPETSIFDWSVREVTFDDGVIRHLVGTVAFGMGRATSPIRSFDLETMTVVTSSGRVYRLCHRPGRDADADYIWGVYKARNGITDDFDVTDQYWDNDQV